MNFEPIYSSERVNLLIHVFEPLRVWLNNFFMSTADCGGRLDKAFKGITKMQK